MITLFISSVPASPHLSSAHKLICVPKAGNSQSLGGGGGGGGGGGSKENSK